MNFKEGQIETLLHWWQVNNVKREYGFPHQSDREIARRKRQIDKSIIQWKDVSRVESYAGR